MKFRLDRGRMTGVILLLLFMAAVSSNAQEIRKVQSKKTGFVLNNIPDTRAPDITIITPALGDENTYFTDSKELDIIVEVKDESRIKMVSVDSKLLRPNEHGLIRTRLSLRPGENRVEVNAMDENDLMASRILLITYTPPVVSLADRIYRDSRYFALLIGINEYDDEGFPDLDNPIRDAGDLRKTLLKNYTFFEEDIITLKNPSRGEIIGELDRLREKVGPEDNLLIFYAGHGYWDEQGRIGYWLPSDATQGSTVDWFRNSTLVDYIQVIRSKHTLLITDACFAGSIFKSRSVKLEVDLAYERIYDMPSRKAMTSGALTEVPDESAFIRYLIQRLNDNRETYLSSEQLFSRIKMAVISNSNAIPRYGEIQNVGNEGGDFIFLKKQ